MNKQDSMRMDAIVGVLEIIGKQIEGVKSAIEISRREALKETESLRGKLNKLRYQPAEGEEYLKAMSASANKTAIKLGALVDHLGLDYTPPGDVYQRAHFKKKKK